MGGLVERARLGGAPASEGDGPGRRRRVRPGRLHRRAAGRDRVAADLEGRRRGGGLAPTGSAGAPSHATGGPRVGTGPAAVAELAGDFRAAGRTGLSRADATALAGLLPTRADRVLYERAMAELSAGEPPVRKRAIRQLAALGARASAPLLASALGREPDAGVKVALLEALGRFQEPFAADLAVRELGDPRPEVRAAALEMLASVAPGGGAAAPGPPPRRPEPAGPPPRRGAARVRPRRGGRGGALPARCAMPTRAWPGPPRRRSAGAPAT